MTWSDEPPSVSVQKIYEISVAADTKPRPGSRNGEETHCKTFVKDDHLMTNSV